MTSFETRTPSSAGRGRRRRWSAVAAAVVLVAVTMSTLGSSPSSADGTTVPGNQNCAQLLPGSRELRVNAPADGTFPANGFSVTMDVQTLTGDHPDHSGDQTGSPVFDFTATGGVVTAVAVKGGPDTQFFPYGAGVTSGSDLHAPVNPSNQKFYGLSHVSFCYVPVVPDIIKLKKVDAGTGATLGGAVLQLWKETNGVGGLQTGGATPDTQVNGNCTTAESDGIGSCTFTVNSNGVYYGHEVSAPSGYACCAADQQVTVTLDTTQDTITLTLRDQRAAGNVRVVKQDDAGTLMDGVTFRLTGTSSLGTVYDAEPAPGDKTCVTVGGTCTISDVELGSYELDEVGGIPATHGRDPNLRYPVVVDENGETVPISVTNPRKHKVIVLVCHEGTNTLAATNVVNGAGSKTSIGDAPTGLTEAQLCGLGGATWGGFSHSDSKTTTAQFGTATHP